ncbi:hypothetical protein ERO13_D11G275750v2 [Gossypium hirsutum]|nr:hypothetical protein ERO13_D11G275750v2 [Gossypium hirsutum]TYI57815.1 hypothetical protein E1A91_D11G308700v1 [Gossypium mustelinum]
MVQQILPLILISNLVVRAIAVDGTNLLTSLAPCSKIPDCKLACKTQGFPKGGVCLGISLSALQCCCIH